MSNELPQTPDCLKLKYRYEQLLGEGSNGKTYLATDLRTGNQLAIKALKLNQSGNFKSFELFKREAETLASLSVPGIPKFYESILADEVGGECYIVQEYIDAPSIQSQLADGRQFSEDQTLTVMQKAAEILQILHTQYAPPIIHRDIKPSNILCDMSDKDHWQDSRLYLIDFGAVANARSNTDKSTIAGTVGYMAPEQNFGECLPQTDLYALGATALHMLTGVPPYEMAFETYTIKYNEALDTYAPETSTEMRELLGMLLHYSYDKRPASAEALLQLIQKVRAKYALVPQNDAEIMAKRTVDTLIDLVNLLFIIPNFFIGTLYVMSSHKINLNSLQLDHKVGAVRLSPVTKKIFSIFAKVDQKLTPSKFEFQFDQNHSAYIRYAFGTAYQTREVQIPDELWFPKSDYEYSSTCIEFTFNANGTSWSGLSRNDKCILIGEQYPDSMTKLPATTDEAQDWIQNRTISYQTYNQESPISYPAKCLVQYKVDDPSYCTLAYLIIEPSNKQTHPKALKKSRKP